MPRARKPVPAPAAALPVEPAMPAEPVHGAAEWREHDLLVRRFHLAGLVPGEIAVVLDSKGLRVKTWHVSETFVRNRLAALGFKPNVSRNVYSQGVNRYRPRPQFRDGDDS